MQIDALQIKMNKMKCENTTSPTQLNHIDCVSMSMSVA